MANPLLNRFVGHLRTTLGGALGLTDSELLERFVTARDESAFEVLLWRHGPMVLGVCRRLLAREQDAEDAFQATFLALARKAGSIGKREALAGWLYTIARRTAQRSRACSAQRPKFQELPGDIIAPESNAVLQHELGSVLDEEIGRLPVKYRLPVLLCYLQGQTTAEAAEQLGCARGTICSRLSWARDRLRSRLVRRGLGCCAGTTLAAIPSQAPARTGLIQATVRSLRDLWAGQGSSSASAALAEGVLQTMFLTRLKLAAVVLLTVSLATWGAGACRHRRPADKPASAAPRPEADHGVIRLPAEQLAPLGIQVGEVRPRPAQPRILRLPGSTALDPTQLFRVRSRVNGEVKEIGEVEEAGKTQPIRVGSKVRKDQILAVVWSSDVGGKKSDLMDALVQLELDRKRLALRQKLYDDGHLPLDTLNQTRRDVMADQNAADRAERTLRAWNIPDQVIEAIKVEAREVGLRGGKRDKEKENGWARVEIRAPQAGTVVERNVVSGEFLAEGTLNLFTIANLDRLLVVVNVPENELPVLASLPEASRKWTVQAAGQPPIEGKIEEVGSLIDPSQHTAVAKGFVANPGQKLRAGQFITAAITLPAPVSEVAVPASAVVEEGRRSFVLVQPDAKQFVYRQRRVLIVRRGHDTVHIRSPLSPAEERQGFQPLRPGERIVTSGALELKALLDDQSAKRKQ